jgi:hypothetical protein
MGAQLPARWPGARAPELNAKWYHGSIGLRRVSHAGTFRLHHKQPFLSNALAGEYIGLEEVGDGLWNIVYYETLLGRIDEKTGRITGVEV